MVSVKGQLHMDTLFDPLMLGMNLELSDQAAMALMYSMVTTDTPLPGTSKQKSITGLNQVFNGKTAASSVNLQGIQSHSNIFDVVTTNVPQEIPPTWIPPTVGLPNNRIKDNSKHLLQSIPEIFLENTSLRKNNPQHSQSGFQSKIDTIASTKPTTTLLQTSKKINSLPKRKNRLDQSRRKLSGVLDRYQLTKQNFTHQSAWPPQRIKSKGTESSKVSAKKLTENRKIKLLLSKLQKNPKKLQQNIPNSLGSVKLPNKILKFRHLQTSIKVRPTETSVSNTKTIKLPASTNTTLPNTKHSKLLGKYKHFYSSLKVIQKTQNSKIPKFRNQQGKEEKRAISSRQTQRYNKVQSSNSDINNKKFNGNTNPIVWTNEPSPFPLTTTVASTNRNSQQHFRSHVAAWLNDSPVENQFPLTTTSASILDNSYKDIKVKNKGIKPNTATEQSSKKTKTPSVGSFLLGLAERMSKRFKKKNKTNTRNTKNKPGSTKKYLRPVASTAYSAVQTENYQRRNKVAELRNIQSRMSNTKVIIKGTRNSQGRGKPRPALRLPNVLGNQKGKPQTALGMFSNVKSKKGISRSNTRKDQMTVGQNHNNAKTAIRNSQGHLNAKLAIRNAPAARKNKLVNNRTPINRNIEIQHRNDRFSKKTNIPPRGRNWDIKTTDKSVQGSRNSRGKKKPMTESKTPVTNNYAKQNYNAKIAIRKSHSIAKSGIRDTPLSSKRQVMNSNIHVTNSYLNDNIPAINRNDQVRNSNSHMLNTANGNTRGASGNTFRGNSMNKFDRNVNSALQGTASVTQNSNNFAAGSNSFPHGPSSNFPNTNSAYSQFNGFNPGLNGNLEHFPRNPNSYSMDMAGFYPEKVEYIVRDITGALSMESTEMLSYTVQHIRDDVNNVELFVDSGGYTGESVFVLSGEGGCWVGAGSEYPEFIQSIKNATRIAQRMRIVDRNPWTINAVEAGQITQDTFSRQSPVIYEQLQCDGRPISYIRSLRNRVSPTTGYAKRCFELAAASLCIIAETINPRRMPLQLPPLF